MSVKAKVEAIIYATEEPVTINQLASLLRERCSQNCALKKTARLVLNEMMSDGKPDRVRGRTAMTSREPETTSAEAQPEPDAEAEPILQRPVAEGRRLDRGTAGRTHQGRIKAG